MRVYFAALIFVATVSACSSGNGGRRAETPSSVPTSPAANRVERCVDRLLQHARPQDLADKQIARRYVRGTYCARFEEEGWIYEDAALRIAAQIWLEHGGTCATGGAAEPAKTVPASQSDAVAYGSSNAPFSVSSGGVR